MPSLKKRRQQLESRLATLQERLNNIEATLVQKPPHDDEDRASEREEDEVLERLGSGGLLEIEMIKAALGRIDAGTYGECVKCGENISRQRLDLLAHAPMCKNCAR